jgi:hypothetical protein
MHGSGTSVVARILSELGVHMGANLDCHAESAEFSVLNEEMLYRAGASWHRVDPLISALERPSFAWAGCLRLAAATYGALRTGYRPPAPGAAAAWGWKDPRNSLTLPLWLRLFPRARVLHVMREPERAAASIHRRALQGGAEGEPVDPAAARGGALARALLYPPAAARTLARRARLLPAFPYEDPCLDLDHCRGLAHLYLYQCFRWRCRAADWLEVRYEDLLEDPSRVVEALADFAVGGVDAERCARAAHLVRRPVRAEGRELCPA